MGFFFDEIFHFAKKTAFSLKGAWGTVMGFFFEEIFHFALKAEFNLKGLATAA
jgi:hypothetical protein